MATKKQKREAAMAKRDQFLKEEKERGLAALDLGRERQKQDRQTARGIAEKINERHAAILRNTTLSMMRQAMVDSGVHPQDFDEVVSKGRRSGFSDEEIAQSLLTAIKED